MPSPSACWRSAFHRAAPDAGNSLPPPARLSRYSQITGESNSTCPSSVVRLGTFIKGFSGASDSFACTGLTAVGTSSMRSARPCSCATTMTLRTKGEAAAWRSFIVCFLLQMPCNGDGPSPQPSPRKRGEGGQPAPIYTLTPLAGRGAGEAKPGAGGGAASYFSGGAPSANTLSHVSSQAGGF